MDFYHILGGCPNKTSLAEQSSFVISLGNSSLLGKEDYWLFYPGRLFLIVGVQTMGTMTHILKLKVINTLSIQIFKGSLFD